MSGMNLFEVVYTPLDSNGKGFAKTSYVAARDVSDCTSKVRHVCLYRPTPTSDANELNKGIESVTFWSVAHVQRIDF